MIALSCGVQAVKVLEIHKAPVDFSPGLCNCIVQAELDTEDLGVGES